MKNRKAAALDLIFACAFAIAALLLTYKAAFWNSAIYTRRQAADIWFDADVYRNFDLAINRSVFNDRGSLHPLWPYFSYPATSVLRQLGRWPESALRIFHSGIAAIWAAAFFLFLRRIKLRRLDASIFTVTAATTASAFFWLPASETFVLGSASMLPALALAAGASPARPRNAFLAAFSSMAITITNGMVGLFAAVVRLGTRKGILVGVGALIAIIGIGTLQKALYPASLTIANGWELNAPWIFALHSGGPFSILRTFFFGSVVAPEIRFFGNWQDAVWPLLSFQFGGLFSGTRWSWIATPAWAGLLGFAIAALRRRDEFADLKRVIVLTVLYQLLLHLLYGGETFLYSMHWVPLLVILAALAAHEARWRPAVLTLAVVLSVANAANNAAQFQWAKEYTTRYEALKEVRQLNEARYGKPLASDPSFDYRFWRDVMHLAPPLATGWETLAPTDPSEH